MLPFESLIGFTSLIDESDTFGLNTSVPELLAPLELFPRVFIGGGKILAIPGGDTVAVLVMMSKQLMKYHYQFDGIV